MSDISLLPDDLRKQREAERARRASPDAGRAGDGFHVPEDRESGIKEHASRVEAPRAPPSSVPLAPQRSDDPSPDSRFQIPDSSTTKPPPAIRRTNGPNGRKRNGTSQKPPLHVPTIGGPSKVPRGITLIPTERAAGAVPHAWVRTATGITSVGVIALIAIGAVLLERRADAFEATVAVVEERAAVRTASRAAIAEDLQRSAGTVRRAVAGRALLAAHVGWEAFLRTLEERTLPGVTYDAFSADVQGAIALSVRAPNVRTAAEQVVAWRAAPIVRSLESSSVTTTLDPLGVVRGVRFEMHMTVDPSAFRSVPPSAPTAMPVAEQ